MKKFNRIDIKLQSTEIGYDWKWDQKHDLSTVTLKDDCIIEGQKRTKDTIMTFDSKGYLFKVN